MLIENYVKDAFKWRVASFTKKYYWVLFENYLGSKENMILQCAVNQLRVFNLRVFFTGVWRQLELTRADRWIYSFNCRDMKEKN